MGVLFGALFDCKTIKYRLINVESIANYMVFFGFANGKDYGQNLQI